MFGRRPKPTLSIGTRLRQGGSTNHPTEGMRYEVAVDVGIKNSGRAIARYPSLAIRIPADSLVVHKRHLRHSSRMAEIRPAPSGSAGIRLVGGADIVIHVDELLLISTLGAWVWHDEIQKTADLVFDFEIMADGVSPVRGAHCLTGTELVALVVQSEQYQQIERQRQAQK